MSLTARSSSEHNAKRLIAGGCTAPTRHTGELPLGRFWRTGALDRFNLSHLALPCFVVDETDIERDCSVANLRQLHRPSTLNARTVLVSEIAEHPMSNEPFATITDGLIKAKIWKTSGPKGNFYSVDITRSFRDPSGQWKKAHSFSGAELLRVSNLAQRAYNMILEFKAQSGDDSD
ncbi:hypothetical protein [Falsiruegeria mediterranea]|nr:hypothetical protein [Falsiruegeria mediterranea]